MTTNADRARSVWIPWFLSYVSGGFIAATLLGIAFMLMLSQSILPMYAPAAGPLGGALGSLAQRKMVGRMRHIHPGDGKWDVIMAVGWGMLYMAAMNTMMDAILGIPVSLTSALILGTLMGLFVGSALGAAQWFFLEERVTIDKWWIVANAGSWAVGGGIFLVGSVLPIAWQMESDNSFLIPPIATILCWSIVGITTGWLLRRYAPKRTHMGEVEEKTREEDS
jgi:hypothetical protein